MLNSLPLPVADFDYNTAFGRNIGLVSEVEQQQLKKLRVAIPGMGGVGSAHVQTLARLGVGGLNLADFDHFDVANIQRQLGASIDTLGRPKVDVMNEAAHGINPGIQTRLFPNGITPETIGEFLQDVDVVIDGLEFFCIKIRRLLFRACRERGIPIITAGPIGYGAALLVFTPQGRSFDDYFGLDDGMTETEMAVAFLLGLSPAMASDLDPRYVDVAKHRGPALISACLMCAACAATEVIKWVTKRGKLAAVPQGLYYDTFRNRTLRLRPKPSITRTLRGRFLRWCVFRKFPAFRQMHEQELATARVRVLTVNDSSINPIGASRR